MYLLKTSGTTLFVDHAGSCKPQGLMMVELVLGVTKKKTKSSVWQHFGLRATEEGVLFEKEQDN